MWIQCYRVPCLTLSMLAVLASPLRAESTKLTLPDCLRRARERNVDLAELEAAIAIARARVDRAEGGRLPRFSYTQLAGVVPRARGDATFSPDEDTDYLNGLGPFTRIEAQLTQPIYAFGRIDEGILAAKGGLRSSRAAKEKKASEVTLLVEEIYWAIALSRALEATMNESVASLDTALFAAKKRLDEGASDVTQADVLKLEFALDTMKKEIIDIAKGGDLARAGLARTLGFATNESFELDDAPLALDPFSPRSLETYRACALRNRPEVEELAGGLEAKTAMIEQVTAEALPALFVLGIVRAAFAPHRHDQTNPFVRDDFNFLEPGLALGLHWDVGFPSLGAIREAQAEHARLLEQTRALESGLSVEVEQAYRALEAAKKVVEVLTHRRSVARSLVLVAIANFELGVGDPRDLLEGLGMHAEASSKHNLAIYEANVAIARLAKAVGGFDRCEGESTVDVRKASTSIVGSDDVGMQWFDQSRR